MPEKRKRPGKPSVQRTRRYDSSRRRAQAAETRSQIQRAAGTLFIERGYAGTTIKAIAEAAGVAEETVYSAFGSKRELLYGLVMKAVLGDPPVPFLDRPEIQAVVRERDQHRQIRMFAQTMTPVLEGYSGLWRVMRAAEPSDPELATLVRQSMRGRMGGMREFITALLGNGSLRPGLSTAHASETVWTLASPDLHGLLRLDLGWSPGRYESWLAESLERLLLG
jgi:AcrR family transcriptional regulator